MLTIEKFIRTYCVRKKDQVLDPPIHSLKDLTLPKNSQLHYVVKDGESPGILINNPLIRNFTSGKVLCEFVTQYTNTEAGGFKTHTLSLDPIIKQYFRANKGLVNTQVSKSEVLLDKNLMVTNYGLMGDTVTYHETELKWWLEFQNHWRSVFETITTKITGNRRNHFVVINLPDLYPSVSQLKLFEESADNSVVRKIANSERAMLAYFWLWWSDSARNMIPTNGAIMDRLNVIFCYHDQWLCFNLASMRLNMKTPSHPKGSWEKPRAQKNMLAMLLSPVYGSIDAMNLAEEPEQEELSTVLQREATKDDTLLTDKNKVGLGVEFSSDPDLSVKDKLAGAFENMSEEVLRQDDHELIERKRNKRVDEVLDSLDVVNANIVDSIETSDSTTQQTAITTDENVPVKAIEREDTIIDYKEYTPRGNDHEVLFSEVLKDKALKGKMTPQQLKRMEKLATRYKEIPDPKTGTGTLAQGSIIKPEDLVISRHNKFTDKINMVNDESMLKSSLIEFDKKYIKNVMHKDIYRAVLSVQRRGIAVQNYQIKRVTQLGDDYEIHTAKLVPIEGEESTISFKVPIINEHGVFQSRSVKNRMRKQRIDKVIRKIAPDEVALSSDMSKMFVHRCRFVAYSQEMWLRAQLVELGGSNNGYTVSYGNAFKNDEDVPRIYSQVARSVKRIRFKDYDLNFDVSKLDQVFGAEVVKVFNSTRNTQILLGKGKDSLLVLTIAGIVHECSIDQKHNVELGSLENFLGIDTEGAPIDCADLDVVNKRVPLGVVLAYYIGLGNLLKTLKVKYTFVPKNTRGQVLEKNQFKLTFADGSLYIDRTDYKAQLILAGFKRYHRHIKEFDLFEFDKKNVYSVLFSRDGLPARYLREFDIMRDMWIDPIAEEQLVSMGEPTDFILLLIRAAELLEKDSHPKPIDRLYQRDRGYERVSGIIYNQLIASVRAYESMPVRAKARVSLNPEAVWMDIISDETTSPIEESNPIHSLKDLEVVVFRGAGGRGARTMNAENRSFSASAIGVDSESTVDNGDAGTVKFLTANPNYVSVRGTTDILDTFDESVNSSCLNTSTLLAPAACIDDPKRRNFITIQNSRTTNSEGAHISPTRTGYERVMPWRTSDLYATVAKEEGSVTRVTKNAIVVKYKSGDEVVVELGKRDGKWSGKIIPHNVITTLKEGQKVKVGDPIAYNPMFFEQDILGGTLAYKSGVLCRIGLIEEEFTYEDSSEISAAFAKKLLTRNCEERTIKVTFDQEVNDLVKVGDEVDYDTILCILNNNIGGVANMFSNDSHESLKDISSLTPRAKNNGRITAITAVYAGDIENMSRSLQAIVSASDSNLFKKARDLNKEKISGQLKVGSRYEGALLEPNSVIIKVTIDVDQDMGIGSKVVYGHQMKSVVSNVWDEVFTTQDGQPYDGKFSLISYIKRIVASTLVSGVVNTFSTKLADMACEIYEKD